MPSTTAEAIKQSLVLARFVESYGVEMIPCSRCEKSNRKCLVDRTKSKRCSECIRARASCDVEGPSSGNWESIDRQKKRLREEEKIAIRAEDEARARVTRLRKQQELLEAREAEMARRGLKYLDELDAIEEAERIARDHQNQQQGESSEAVDDLPGFVLPDSPSFWEGLDVDGGIAPEAQGS
jgi:hypothetical protein